MSSSTAKEFYLGNQRLKRVNVPVTFTREQVEEYIKCSNDIVYFVRKYIKIVNVDRGVIPFELWPFQENMINTFANNRFSICKLPRQSGKTSVTAAVILWYILFHESYSVALLAHKLAQAREILGRIQLAYENLPRWMQQGVVEWNKSSVVLENGSKILAAATSSSAVRGGSFSCVAGHSVVTLRINDKIFDVTINTLWENFRKANSSKYICKPDQEGVYVFRKQILQVVSKYYNQSPKYTDRLCYGDSSHNTEMYGGYKFSREFNKSNNQRTFNTPSTVSEVRILRSPQTKTSVCSFEDDAWTTGTALQATSTVSTSIYENVIGASKGDKIRSQSFSRDASKNKSSSQRQETIKCYQTKDIREEQRSVIGDIKIPESQKQYISSTKGETQNFRTYAENQPQSRQNSKNSSEASRDETFRRITDENEFSCAWQSALEQGEKIEILTNWGYKGFLGIKQTSKQKTIEVIYKDGCKIECTPNHLVYENGQWVEAKDLSNVIKRDCVEQDVFDVVGVEDVSSFICNGINVHNCIYLDEFAFVPAHFQNDFFASVYPTISSGNTTKVIITSTPKGLNMFYKMWTDAVESKSSFVPFEVHWSDVPGRDEKWKEETIKNTSERQFREEFEVEFIGSSNTLINPSKLLNIPIVNPIKYTDDYAVYEDPTQEENKKNLYVLVADTSRGVGRDYSGFVVYNVSQLPYRVAARYKNNEISPLIFPNVIHQFAKMYNDAYTCIEINDNGQQVADILYRELEYENIVMAQMKGRSGQMISGGFASRPTPGVRTTAQVKRIGCTNFKTLVETDKLILNDAEIVDELYRFVEIGDSFAAEEGANDDLVMCCVLFAWMTMQPYFREWTDTNVREKLQQDNLKLLEEDLVPFELNIGDDFFSPEQVRELSGSAFDRWLLSEND